MGLRLLCVGLLVALVAAGGALAARGDPQKRIIAADQARAQSILLRKADLGPGFKATRASKQEGDFYCRALDESDLTVTGEAESHDFERATVLLSSVAEIYATLADANASWRRGTSVAGEACIRDVFRREFVKQGIGVAGFRRMSFPQLAQRSVAYRLIASKQGVRLYLDVVVLQQSRAHAALLVGSLLEQASKADVVRLARVVEGRMRVAMRGA